MAEFNWILVPPHGSCVVCGTSVCERGFVDFVGDTLVFNRDAAEFTGVVDMHVCATCVEQASRRVGCADRDQVEQFAYRELELVGDLEKAVDEAQSWKQRYDSLLTKLTEEIRAEISGSENFSEANA